MFIKIIRKFLSGLVALLFLCSSAQASDWIYTVVEGDTLWGLSTNFLIDVQYWRKLQGLNGITDPHYLHPGSKLRIPLKWSRSKPAHALVEKINGEVSVSNGLSAAKPVEQGMQLQVGDRLETHAGASVTLIFGDGSSMLVREKSDLQIEALESYGNENAFNTLIKLNRGRSDNQVNPEKKPGSRFEIETPSATAAVRGTRYRVSAADQTTTTEVLEGAVGVSNHQGDTALPKGYGSQAKRDQAPSAPISLLPAADLSHMPKQVEGLAMIAIPVIYRASAYRLQLAKEAKFQALDLDQVTKTPSLDLHGMEDGEYYLRVRGIDHHQLEGFNATHHFVLNNFPRAPALLRPLAGAVVANGYNSFTWIAGSDHSQYRFQLADNPEFDLPLVDKVEVLGGFLRIKKSLGTGEWYWRVATIDAQQGLGPFSKSNSFTIEKPSSQVHHVGADPQERQARLTESEYECIRG